MITPPRVDRYARPRPSPAMAVALPGRATVRGTPADPMTVTVPGDFASGPGVSTAKDFVAASKTAHWGRPARGSTWPAGDTAVGGDDAARAGSMVGGATSILVEHPPSATDTASATTARARHSGGRNVGSNVSDRRQVPTY